MLAQVIGTRMVVGFSRQDHDSGRRPLGLRRVEGIGWFSRNWKDWMNVHSVLQDCSFSLCSGDCSGGTKCSQQAMDIKRVVAPAHSTTHHYTTPIAHRLWV